MELHTVQVGWAGKNENKIKGQSNFFIFFMMNFGMFILIVFMCVSIYRWCVCLIALVGQSAEDASLRHLQACCDWWDSGQCGRKPCYISFHITEQLLQLVEN